MYMATLKEEGQSIKSMLCLKQSVMCLLIEKYIMYSTVAERDTPERPISVTL